jgi:CarD family transcriptional regulator
VDYLFEVGDKIVYPMHGAGVIKSIEEKEVLGKTQQYYIIKMPINNMEVMVPIGKISNLGIRLVVDTRTLENVFLTFNDEELDTSIPWKQRHRINMEKMKTGEIQEGAEVVRDLTRRSKDKALNTSERQMLNDAQRILISELVLIKGLTENQASVLLNNKMNG